MNDKKERIVKVIYSLILTFVVLFGIYLITGLMNYSGEEDERANLVDEVTMKYMDKVEEEGYISEFTKSSIKLELSELDEVIVIGTEEKVNSREQVNLTVQAKDGWEIYPFKKKLDKETSITGFAK